MVNHIVAFFLVKYEFRFCFQMFIHPMQHVGLDLFSFGGKDYLICMDHWSGYPLYQFLRSTTSESVIRTLSTWFNLLGWPSSIRSDGDPQFWDDFSNFYLKHDIRHELSAPYNPKMVLPKQVSNQ